MAFGFGEKRCRKNLPLSDLDKSMNQRVHRQFDLRSDAERQWMLDNTWCNNCNAADLGMSNPREYGVDDKIYVEGDCNQCGQPVVSEIDTRDLPEA